jgi:hypothetical protein
MLKAHWVYAGGIAVSVFRIIEIPDTPPEAILLGRRKRLKLTAMMKAPIRMDT